MATTRLQLQTDIYYILGKTSTSAGFLDTTKINMLIGDAMQFISAEMIGGNATWRNKQSYINILANTASYSLPTDCALINFVKKKSLDQYVPISYSESAEYITSTTSATGADYTPTWRFMEGKMLLEPTPGTAQTAGILLDYIQYPADLSGDSSTLATDVDFPPFIQFIKWHAAAMAWQLTSESAATPPAWQEQEKKWFEVCKKIIAKHNARVTTVHGFVDY